MEQQGKTVQELNELWAPEFWDRTFAQVEEYDKLITEFNERTGLLKTAGVPVAAGRKGSA